MKLRFFRILGTRTTTRIITSVLAASAVATIATPANAGEFLRFKQGTVHTTTMPTWLIDDMNGPASGAVGYYVIQFKDKIRAADHALIAQAGAKEFRYVPDDALIVRASRAAARSIANAANVQAMVPYNARWKLSPEVRPSALTALQLDRVLVRVFASDELAGVAAKIAALPGAKVEEAKGKSILVTLPTARIAKIVEFEGVEWTERMPVFQTMEARLLGDDDRNGATPAEPQGDFSDLNGFESGAKAMGFEKAWAHGYDGSGQIGAMADTGLDSGDVNTVFASFRGQIVNGYGLGFFSDGWGDSMGHGTHVSGSVMGNGGPSGDKVRGGAYGARLVAESLWSPLLGGLAMPSHLEDVFSKARNDGARVHTNSWGSPRNLGAYDGIAQQVDEYMYANPDFLVLFAAGNSGVDANKDGRIDPGSIGSPATAKNCLTVGASKNLVSKGGIQKKMSELRNGMENWGVEPIASSVLSDNVNGLAAFSSRGPTSDGRLKPEVVAPGTNILSNRSHNKGAEPLWGAYNADYAWSGGTSMATPLVAGAAIVTRQYLIAGKGMSEPTAALVKATLMHTAIDFYPGQFGAVGASHGQELLSRRPTNDAGYGRIDMDAATALDGVQLFDDKTGVGTDEAKSFTFVATADGKLTATLVWTDPAGADAASKALVNDLDLAVVDSSGHETTLKDSTNNAEMIEMPASAGAYQIRVKGANVPQGRGGKQPFALVVSVK